MEHLISDLSSAFVPDYEAPQQDEEGPLVINDIEAFDALSSPKASRADFTGLGSISETPSALDAAKLAEAAVLAAGLSGELQRAVGIHATIRDSRSSGGGSSYDRFLRSGSRGVSYTSSSRRGSGSGSGSEGASSSGAAGSSSGGMAGGTRNTAGGSSSSNCEISPSGGAAVVLEPLRENSQFQVLRRMLQASPNMLATTITVGLTPHLSYSLVEASGFFSTQQITS